MSQVGMLVLQTGTMVQRMNFDDTELTGLRLNSTHSPSTNIPFFALMRKVRVSPACHVTQDPAEAKDLAASYGRPRPGAHASVQAMRGCAMTPEGGGAYACGACSGPRGSLERWVGMINSP
jgi:hypothetical protein